MGREGAGHFMGETHFLRNFGRGICGYLSRFSPQCKWWDCQLKIQFFLNVQGEVVSNSFVLLQTENGQPSSTPQENDTPSDLSKNRQSSVKIAFRSPWTSKGGYCANAEPGYETQISQSEPFYGFGDGIPKWRLECESLPCVRVYTLCPTFEKNELFGKTSFMELWPLSLVHCSCKL